LRNEKIAAQNVGQALAAAQEKIKLKELETRDLEAHLQSLSHTSDGHNSRSTKLEREKSMLEARVRELEGNLRQLSCPPTMPGRTNVARPRSSSLSNFRITTLEQELNDARASLSQRDTELRLANEKLGQVQNELIKVSNERLAMEKRTSRQVTDLQASLEEKEEELQYVRQQEGDGGREEELLKRIEEDEAKIVTLEGLLQSGQDTKQLENRLRYSEEKLKEESKRLVESEERHIELIREKEDALDELEDARSDISKLSKTLAQRKIHINELTTMDGYVICCAGIMLVLLLILLFTGTGEPM
jgi:chromosome segregation ATPase